MLKWALLFIAAALVAGILTYVAFGVFLFILRVFFFLFVLLALFLFVKAKGWL
jgi:hypothetical protein